MSPYLNALIDARFEYLKLGCHFMVTTLSRLIAEEMRK